MMQVSLQDFLRTGAFGPLHLGTSRATVYLHAGPPDTYNASWGKDHAPCLWKYGDFEFYFHLHDDRLYTIFRDSFCSDPPGGPQIAIDPWVLQPGVSREAVEAHLSAAGVPHAVREWPYDATEHVLVGPGIEIAFCRVKVVCGPPPGWCGLSYGNHQLPAETDDPDEALHSLHARFRGRDAEDAAWRLVLPDRARPVPSSLAHDLIDRGAGVDALAFAQHADEVWWRLAGVSDAALLRFGRTLYCSSERAVADVACLLQEHASNPRLLAALAHIEPSSPAKESAYLQVAAAHRDPDRFAAHLEERRLDLRARDERLDPAEYLALAAAGQPRVLRALAANPSTPTQTLQALVYVEGIEFASKIRIQARHNLAARKRVLRKQVD